MKTRRGYSENITCKLVAEFSKLTWSSTITLTADHSGLAKVDLFHGIKGGTTIHSSFKYLTDT